MSYPKKLLKRKVRITIMILLIIAFFVISPIIILYTTGYRYDISTRQIKQIGVIGVDVEPREVEVFLNNIKVDKRPPMRLSNRAPGTHHLRLSLPGYHTWEKEITVESKKTTYIRDITLFKQSLPVSIISDSFESVSFSPDGKYALLTTQNDSVYETRFFDLNNLQTIPLSRIHSNEKPRVSWSSYYPAAALVVSGSQDTQIQIVDMLRPETISNTNKLESSEFNFIKWQSDDSPWGYIKDGNQIVRLSPTTKKILFTLDNNFPWYVDQDQNLWNYLPDESIIQMQRDGGSINYLINDQVTDLIYIGDNKIIYKTNEGTKINYLAQNNERESRLLPTEFNQYNKATNEWLSWSPWELWTIHQNNLIDLLYRTSEKIEFISPLDEHGVLLVAGQNKIQAFNPGYYVTTNLFSGGKIYSIGTDIEQRKIYFWGSVGSEEGVFELEY